MRKLMKILVFTSLLLVIGLSGAIAQKKGYQQDPAKMTPEQRMVQSNAKHKNGGRNANVSKKVKRAKKQDRAARRMKQPKTNNNRKKG
jgi:hypothetical protein